jgi:hypothetical protein
MPNLFKHVGFSPFWQGWRFIPWPWDLARLIPMPQAGTFPGFLSLIFLVTLVLLFFRNRFSAVLLAAVIAYNLRLLESTNLWDYLVDPILVLVSAVYFL